MAEIMISVIMPVYNAVNYVGNAIQSVLEQSYQEFELILIDDGSDDGSEQICKNYGDKYQNIVYVRQDNKGICAARNAGIKLARGKFIAFIDHDDFYKSDYLKLMLEKQNKADAELVRCGVLMIEELPDGRVSEHTECMPEKKWDIKTLAEQFMYLSPSHFTVWNCLYSKKLLLENDIWFPEEMKHGQEDYCFNLCVFKHAQNEEFVQKELYIHYRRVGQSTSAKYYPDTIQCMAANLNKEIDLIDRYLFDHDNNVIQKWVLYARKITGLLFYCFRACDEPEKISIDMLKEFEVLIMPLKKEWNMNIKILGKVFLVSKKYFWVVFMSQLKKWNILVKSYKVKYAKLIQ